MEDLREKFYS